MTHYQVKFDENYHLWQKYFIIYLKDSLQWTSTKIVGYKFSYAINNKMLEECKEGEFLASNEVIESEKKLVS